MIEFFSVLASVYVVHQLVLASGIWRSRRIIARSKQKSGRPTTRVTVIVCARDEEETLDRCLEALSRLDYPSELLQILVMNDGSTDRTSEILSNWQERMPNLEPHDVTEKIDNLRGKMNALALAFHKATGEIVAITDADCAVPRGWVSEYVKAYSADTGMVAAITAQQSKNVWDGMQALDLAYLLGIELCGANIGIPLSAIGNNMSVRKSAYESIGGYEGIPFSVTEDFALFQGLWNSPQWNVRYCVDPNLSVVTLPVPNLRTWWQQRKRWVKGGGKLPFGAYVIYAVGFIGNIMMILAPILLPLRDAAWIVGLKWLADLVILLPILAFTSQLKKIVFFIFYQVYLLFFICCMPVMILGQRAMTWRGRKY